MRFLCVSDIHGHAKKLQAVLDEGKVLGYDQLVACGDHLFPGPDPLDTWKILVENHALCVQGLTDAAVSQIDPNVLTAETPEQEARLERLQALHTELGELIVRRLSQLKIQARLPLESGHELVIVHGSPVDPTEPMCIDMDDEEINALIGDDPGDMIVCGASHVPFERALGDIRIVSVGSVGESPAGNFAHGTIIDSTAMGITVSQFDVEV